MQRARRLAFLAVSALVGTVALTGCRSQPSAAIYIGANTYSQKYVDELSGQLQKLPGFTRGEGRKNVTQWLVVRDLGKRMVADKHWPAPQIDEQAATAQIQDALQSSGGQGNAQQTVQSVRPLIQLYAQYEAYRGAVQQHVTLAQPTDADYADLYQRAQAAGLVPAGMDEAAYRQSLGAQNDQLFRANVSMRGLYSEAIKKANVSINPKYAPAELALLHDSANHPLVVIPLNAKPGQPAVVPAPVQASAQGQTPGQGQAPGSG
jgi:hypothetical protein